MAPCVFSKKYLSRRNYRQKSIRDVIIERVCWKRGEITQKCCHKIIAQKLSRKKCRKYTSFFVPQSMHSAGHSAFYIHRLKTCKNELKTCLPEPSSWVLANDQQLKLWVFSGYDGNNRWILANVLANQTSLLRSRVTLNGDGVQLVSIHAIPKFCTWNLII